MSQIHAHRLPPTPTSPLPRHLASRAPGRGRQLPASLGSPRDDAERFFVGWWQRMHRGRRGLVAASIKRVAWPDDSRQSGRYVWEVCKWPMGNGNDWTFVCWMIDGVGAWWLRFPTKQKALAYYRQSAASVLSARESTTPKQSERVRAPEPSITRATSVVAA